MSNLKRKYEEYKTNNLFSKFYQNHDRKLYFCVKQCVDKLYICDFDFVSCEQCVLSKASDQPQKIVTNRHFLSLLPSTFDTKCFYCDKILLRTKPFERCFMCLSHRSSLTKSLIIHEEVTQYSPQSHEILHTEPSLEETPADGQP